MREIKFRGKRQRDGVWVFGHYHVNPMHAIITSLFDGNYMDNTIIPETIGQFTGLHDKNGKEIFEGDVVKLDLNNEGFKEAVVSFKYGCFVFDTPKEVYTVWESDVLETHITVIGNIHEGKE